VEGETQKGREREEEEERATEQRIEINETTKSQQADWDSQNTYLIKKVER